MPKLTYNIFILSLRRSNSVNNFASIDTGNLADYIGIDADAGLIVFAEKGVIHLSTTSGDWISNEKPVLPSHGIEFRVHRRYKLLRSVGWVMRGRLVGASGGVTSGNLTRGNVHS